MTAIYIVTKFARDIHFGAREREKRKNFAKAVRAILVTLS